MLMFVFCICLLWPVVAIWNDCYEIQYLFFIKMKSNIILWIKCSLFALHYSWFFVFIINFQLLWSINSFFLQTFHFWNMKCFADISLFVIFFLSAGLFLFVCLFVYLFTCVLWCWSLLRRKMRADIIERANPYTVVCCLVGWLFGWLFVCLFGCLVGWLFVCGAGISSGGNYWTHWRLHCGMVGWFMRP